MVWRHPHDPVVGPRCVIPPNGSLKEKPVGGRRAPGELRNLHGIDVVRGGFGRAVLRDQANEAVTVGLLLVGGVDLVLLRDLPRQAAGVAAVVIDRVGRPARVRRVDRSALGRVVVFPRQPLLGLPLPVRRIEPQSVLHDRAAQRRSNVVGPLDSRRPGHAPRAQVFPDVVALKRPRRPVDDKIPREPVASLLGHDVDADAACLAFGGDAAHLDVDFLGVQPVDAVDTPLELDAVLSQFDVVGTAMDREHRRRSLALRAADIHPAERPTAYRNLRGRDERGVHPGIEGDRERIHFLFGEHLPRHDILGVHHRGRPRDRHGLLERPYPQIGIHRRGKCRLQLDALAFERTKTRQSKRDGVHAGPEIDDPIKALVVGDDDADLFDQRGTGGFDRDARQHGA